MIVPGGELSNARGSSVGRPRLSRSQRPGSGLPAAAYVATAPLLVSDVDWSTRIGSPFDGMQAAMGLLVNTGDEPPNGATDVTPGSVTATSAISFLSATSGRYACNAPM